MRLLLFDLDGTLLVTHGLGRRVVAGVLTDLLGRPVDPYGASFSGKTDPQIFRELLVRESATGADVDDLDSTVRKALARYSRAMAERLRTAEVTALPGARALVDRLAARDDVVLGLLTGNLQPLAYAKLRAAGFPDGLFAPGLGAFGDDDEDRDCLGPHALRRAGALAGRPFAGAEAVVIGDTPRDIACARAMGAAVVGVATGAYTRDDLAEADLVLDSLDAVEIEALIGAGYPRAA